jgi:hypothetical protein
MAEITATIPAAGAAVTQDTIIGEAPFDGTVTAASILPEAAVTGATATARTFTLVNKGQAGAGAVTIATLVLITSNNMVAFDEKDMVLTATAADLLVAKGDVIALVETVAGAGTAHTGGVCKVTITPRNV